MIHRSGGLIVQFLAPDESGCQRAEVRLRLEDSPAGEVFRNRAAAGALIDSGLRISQNPQPGISPGSA